MPTYGYECEECGHRFDSFQAMSAPKLEACPECSGRVRRLIGPGAGVIVRSEGTGRADSRRGDARSPCGADRTCCGRDGPCEKRPCDR